ncbi:uncharacterized protein BP01DRAFT_379119 [Aspergillus saccharolyticus JOP 1030-1]|uniref:Uncharacterized protein n=1 Tax=Aspergillus saccharolyticus JOP 1030-1 TaxID=1450539 RepID=A0A318ZM73_9EURO|nr:hypothetical protein BP01DRAFT_379119 [Aspergillus saccharolyticus JOP 1030-1]PYH48711.1 hypothetical protein BP01DRAFT_379119 [Aspergillus saccharolyticus JOP 1030-1]
MLSSSDSIALTAFIVSLNALSVTILQLLQQYFATAQGYNRCSRRYIGEWSRFRHRRYVWREFRFEVTFVRPVIYLGSPRPARPGNEGDLKDEWSWSWSLYDLIPSVRRDRAWRAQYVGRSMRIRGLMGDLEAGDADADIPVHVSWLLFLRHLMIYDRQATRAVWEKDSQGGQTVDQPLGTGTARVNDRALEAGVVLRSETKQQANSASDSEFGICIRFEPCTWDDLSGQSGSLTGIVSLRDLLVLNRLLGLEWCDGPFLQSKEPRPSLLSQLGLQAVGNSLAVSEDTTPQLRYEQREAKPPRLQRPRRETFHIHRGTMAMFYGHIPPAPKLLPTFDEAIAIDGDAAWESLVRRMWLRTHDETPPRQSLANCLLALCCTIISEPDMYAVRVPKPHRYLVGPFVRPKIAHIFREGVCQTREQDSGQSRMLDKICEALMELESFSGQESVAPLVSAERKQTELNFWVACQGASPMWTSFETNHAADAFFRLVHEWISWVEAELVAFVQRSDPAVGTYVSFYWDLVSAWMEFVVGAEKGEHGSAPHTQAHNPFAMWRRTMKALFECWHVIEEGVRKRGRWRAVMLANGVFSADLESDFDVLVPCDEVVGYEAISSTEIRDACLAMIFRGMCWHRCHCMEANEEPFRPEFFSNVQQVMIE